ncbi:MAG: aspartate 1-decarboxylase [Caldiserica bacterium]|nr:MAG: aspartate 1-decarboxylase [Caldisericota bacterium]
MQRIMLKSKIHRARITRRDLNYEGSITIDRDLAEKANLQEFEKVDIYNIFNGERFSTYVLYGKRGSGCIELNGAAARKGETGDIIIIVSYAMVDEKEIESFTPTIIFVDKKNRIREKKLSDIGN